MTGPLRSAPRLGTEIEWEAYGGSHNGVSPGRVEILGRACDMVPW